MTTFATRRLLAVALAMSLAAGFIGHSSLVGQEATAKKARAQAKGRLPAYFKDVVTEKQRDEIYAIQKKYEAQIEALEEQLKSLQSQRDTEIEGLLSAEQKEKLEKLRADAASKRKTKTEATASSESTEATATTTAAAEPATAKTAAPAAATKSTKATKSQQ
jgi:hypothetical protein